MKKRGLRTHEWKLIVPLETPDLHGHSEIELYHLSSDPGELRNIAPERPEVVARLRGQMDAWIAERLAVTGLPDPLPLQPIPLRRVGKMSDSLPGRSQEERAANATGDEKLATGDFIGYDREN